MSVTTEKPAGATAIRPFEVHVPQADLEDLRRRIAATRWPDKETVSDRSQGVQLAKLRPLVEYRGTGCDWRKVEATLNALPQFITEIDGLDIQFAHIRSPHDEALPLLMTHGPRLLDRGDGRGRDRGDRGDRESLPVLAALGRRGRRRPARLDRTDRDHIFAPLAASLLQLGVARQREYLADATTAELLGRARPLALDGDQTFRLVA